MLPIQQLIKALRALQCSAGCYSDLAKNLQFIATAGVARGEAITVSPATLTTLLTAAHDVHFQTIAAIDEKSEAIETLPKQQLPTSSNKNSKNINISSQQTTVDEQTSHTLNFSLTSHLNEHSSPTESESEQQQQQQHVKQLLKSASVTTDSQTTTIATAVNNVHLLRNQRIQKFYQQQLQHFHTQQITGLCSKQKQAQFAMSSLAAEPLAVKQEEYVVATNGKDGSDCQQQPTSGASCNDTAVSSAASASGKPCFNTGLAEILQFMELIGNLKHTKRTGWVLRDVNDCESISGHMYRMSMMTFLLDGSEGLNQIRCMELALVHDLAESLVGDITPFCGVSKQDKRAMEFKAMEDICKLIEPRGKRIMELFEEYELGESAESKFVKDLDRLDMVMQAFEYEKRDNCLLKHQEFFDSTEGKFNHPFVKKLVDEIYEQRKSLAKAKGATPPPAIEVPDMSELPSSNECTSASLQQQQQNLSTTSR